MAARPASGSGPQALRLEILKELQQLIDSREARDRVDKSPIAETKGREHWILHLTLRAMELQQSHVNTLIGSAYSNLVSRLAALEDRLAREGDKQVAFEADLRTRLEGIDTG